MARFFRSAFALALPALLGGCAEKLDKPFCAEVGCEFTEWEWSELKGLAGLEARPPVDKTNKYYGNPGAEALGRFFFFDTRFSGPSTLQDSLRRPVPYGRGAKGAPTGISCATCHDLRRGGIDTTSVPGHIAIGAGWADTNSIPAYNAAFYGIQYWTGRADSMWAQAISSSEGNNMNGNRLATAWVIQDAYRAMWDATFSAEYPFPAIPPTTKSADVRKLLETNGQCKLVGNVCPVDLGCREVKGDGGTTSCWPRIPLEGRPGSKAGCQPTDATEPSWDAFDCMDKKDQDDVTRLLINWAKALAAYEYTLVSRDSPFDRFVTEMGKNGSSTQLSAAAQRGAKLFVGKAACNDCHRTPLLSDSEFHNIGVPQVGPNVPTEEDCPDGGNCDCVANPDPTRLDASGKPDPYWGVRSCLPWGARTGIMRLRANEFRRDSAWSDDPTDTSRKRYVEMNLSDIPVGAWRTPSLRDVALTAPYMHNGAMATLEEVVAHYNAGGSSSAPGPRSPRIKPLGLTEAEQSDLVAFLKTLTGAPLPNEIIGTPPLP
jgi:cytochrome c peroxidase